MASESNDGNNVSETSSPNKKHSTFIQEHFVYLYLIEFTLSMI